MKKIYLISSMFIMSLFTWSCTDLLDLSPKDKVSAKAILSTAKGVEMYMANLYDGLPVEDFCYSPFTAMSMRGSGVNNSGINAAMCTEEASPSEHNAWTGTEAFDYWEAGYKSIRRINTFIDDIATIKVTGVDNDALMGEALFLRAYTYFALAKRYGGLPIVDHVQDYSNDFESLKIPRSTEQATWDFILNDLDGAITKLPDNTNTRRASRGAALAFKTRAALYAGSVARYTHAPYVTISGTAVTNKLIAMDASLADGYFKQCIDAAEDLISGGKFGLYGATPNNAEQAAVNYQALFEDPNTALGASQEPMFVRGYAVGTGFTHNIDLWYRPNQAASGWPHPGRMNPTADFVDMYEDYTDDGGGQSAKIKTRVDGNENDMTGFNKDVKYIHYPLNAADQIFKNKDARLHASVILPGSTWKKTPIVIQGGYVNQDGSLNFRTHGSAVGKDGKTYYTFGGSNLSDYSGFATDGGNYTRTGFLYKKMMSEKKDVAFDGNINGRGETDWIELRYAEVLLNYAEAVAEYTQATGAMQTGGKKALNDIRRRAAHTDNIALTIANVRKERAVELAFENRRFWDLHRWRNYHKVFENKTLTSLVPFVDLREDTPSYIYVRMNIPNVPPRTFTYTWYYRQIPGTGNNGLIQNP